MLKYRLMSAAILIPVIISALFCLSLITFSIIILVICMLAAWEWGKLSNLSSLTSQICLSALYGLLLSTILFLFMNNSCDIHQLMISSSMLISLCWWFIALFLVLSYPKSSVIWKYSKILRLIFGFLTIVPFFCGVIALRSWHLNQDYRGILWLFYTIVLVWGTDSGAYIFGKLLGKRKLAPKISPGKTWQGFIGGLTTAMAISLNHNVWIDLEITQSMSCIYSITVSLASLLGDLTESMLKREAGIKDSGNLIPGHGGILDRIDGLTAAIPILICLFNFLEKSMTDNISC